MRQLITLLIIGFGGVGAWGQDYVGYFRTMENNTYWHQFSRNGGGAAVYINQISTNGSYPILRLSSGHKDPNVNVKLTVENNGNVGIGVITPKAKLHVVGSTTIGGTDLSNLKYA